MSQEQASAGSASGDSSFAPQSWKPRKMRKQRPAGKGVASGIKSLNLGPKSAPAPAAEGKKAAPRPKAAPEPAGKPAGKPAGPKPAGVKPYLGAAVSLTIKNNLRFQGVLKDINPTQKTVTLTTVRCFGTEGRNATTGRRDLPPNPNIANFLVFKASDIAKLVVVQDKAKQQAPAGPPGPYGAPPMAGGRGRGGPGRFGPPQGRGFGGYGPPSGFARPPPGYGPPPGFGGQQRPMPPRQQPQTKAQGKLQAQKPKAQKPQPKQQRPKPQQQQRPGPAAPVQPAKQDDGKNDEFDFAAANATYRAREKEEKRQQTTAEDEVDGDDDDDDDEFASPAPVIKQYDKNSFFDNLSTKRAPRRKGRDTDPRDVETFGVQAKGYKTQSGYRRKRRGRRNGGRGGEGGAAGGGRDGDSSRAGAVGQGMRGGRRPRRGGRGGRRSGGRGASGGNGDAMRVSNWRIKMSSS